MPNEWDRTPWMMGGNAIHSVNVGRLLAYAAFGGDEGIIGTGDLQVRSAAVPNGTVRVMPGACAILNRGLNISYEAYAARLPIADTVAISATGSGSGRSDLIVAVVMNPYQDGEPWPDPNPSDVAAGTAEFVKTMVIPNVPANTKNVKSLNLGYSAIALARIDIPPSTGTITQAMIVDLRQMSQVRQKRVTKALHVPGYYPLGSLWGVWPPQAQLAVEIPEWANYAFMKGMVTGAYRAAGNMNITMTMELSIGPGQWVQSGQTVLDVDSPTSADRISLVIGGGRVAIPAAWRGLSGTCTILAYNATPAVEVATSTGLSAIDIEIVFGQDPESSQ